MANRSSVKVSTAARDELRAIANRDGITIDAALRKLLRLERQRRMGADLASRPVNADDLAWIAGSSSAVARTLD